MRQIKCKHAEILMCLIMDSAPIGQASEFGASAKICHILKQLCSY